MGLETATFVDGLNSANPLSGDSINEGDDHIRLLKSVLKATFPDATSRWNFRTVSSKSGAYTVVAADEGSVLLADATSGSFTITCQNSPTTGFKFGVVKTNAANAVTIDGDGSDTINGAATRSLTDQYQSEVYMWTGSAWVVIYSHRSAVEAAIASEVNTGTDTEKFVTPDALAESNYGKAIVPILVFDDSADVVVGDGAGDVFFRVPSSLDGWNLVEVAASVQTSGTTGTTDIQIRNVTQAADMLTTKITIDSGETDSSTAAAAAVIDAANDDVATADQLRIDVDAVSTTAPKGLLVELTFQLP